MESNKGWKNTSGIEPSSPLFLLQVFPICRPYGTDSMANKLFYQGFVPTGH
jgi:hypothetical protein